MKHKLTGTLQGKLTLFVSFLILTLTIFFFGNYALEKKTSQSYIQLVDHRQLVSQYSKTLAECRDDLIMFTNSLGDIKSAEHYEENAKILNDLAEKLWAAFPDPYTENLVYLSKSLTEQGKSVADCTQKRQIEAARQAYSDFSRNYGLLDKYMLYVEKAVGSVSSLQIQQINSRQEKNFRMMLFIFCGIAACLTALSWLGIRQIIRPIKHLTEMAHLVVQNIWDLPRWEHPGRDETGILLNSFYHMVETIRRQMEKLERQRRLELQRKEEEEKKLQLEYRNVQLELKALQNQVNPHFLFNCLNMIAKQAYIEDAAHTQHTTEAVARYLRSVLDYTDETATIEKEMQQVKHYLELQSMRFGDRFTYQINCDPQCAQLYVPFMIVQPLVENIFTHGIDICARHICLSCNAQMRGERVWLYVTDDGPGMSQEQTEHLKDIWKDPKRDGKQERIGLLNVFRRIQLHFSGQADVCIESIPYVKTVVGFSIPAHTFRGRP